MNKNTPPCYFKSSPDWLVEVEEGKVLQSVATTFLLPPVFLMFIFTSLTFVLNTTAILKNTWIFEILQIKHRDKKLIEPKYQKNPAEFVKSYNTKEDKFFIN